MCAKWGTHGDHATIALMPASVQETYEICGLAKRIRPENRICFNSSEDVKKRGYIPCAACLPV